MELRMEPVTRKSKEIRKIKAIYTSSFLKEDRMPFWLMLIMAKTSNTEFISFHDGDILCGFVYMATIKNLTFVMFFAVDESVRSKGYGSRILEETQLAHPHNKIIVSIERCTQDAKDIEQKLRRKRFYTNNGYTETGYLVELGNQKQEVLIKNGTFAEEEFISFFKRYSNGTIKPKLLTMTP
ncbi:MAG: GNAT family N-acetyltransferase [Angelakisella sp.]